jgi:hypothetical protein
LGVAYTPNPGNMWVHTPHAPWNMPLPGSNSWYYVQQVFRPSKAVSATHAVNYLLPEKKKKDEAREGAGACTTRGGVESFTVH